MKTLFTNSLILFSMLILSVISCSKSGSVTESGGSTNTFIAQLASVTTTAVTSISVNSAVSGGTVTAEGSSPVSERGICYGTTTNPTVANNKITSGSGAGVFYISLSSLSANTNYYIRAYAINSSGISYGNEVSFVTSPVVVVPVDLAETIYTGGGNSLYAFNAQTGSLKWKKTIGTLPAYVSSPAYANGIVYVLSSNKLLAYDSTGVLKWTYTISGSSNLYYQAPIVKNGIVYCASENTRDIYAVNAISGTLIWTHAMPASGSIIRLQNDVLVAEFGNAIFGFDAFTGVQKWVNTSVLNASPSNTPLLLNNKIYVTAIQTINALDINSGLLLWSKQDFLMFANVFSTNIAYSSIYCMKTTGLNCLDSATGNLKWSASNSLIGSGANYKAGILPILKDSILFSSSLDGMWAYNAITGAPYIVAGYPDNKYAGGDGGTTNCATIINKTMFLGTRSDNPGSGHFFAKDILTHNTLWMSSANDDFYTSIPCVVTYSGKIYRCGSEY